MIHYKSVSMARVACLAVSPQASSADPLAVDCPACKADPRFVPAVLGGLVDEVVSRVLSAPLLAQNASGVPVVGAGDAEAATGFSACLPGIAKVGER